MAPISRIRHVEGSRRSGALIECRSEQSEGHDLDRLGEVDGRLVSGHRNPHLPVRQLQVLRGEARLLVAEDDGDLLARSGVLQDQPGRLGWPENP